MAFLPRTIAGAVGWVSVCLVILVVVKLLRLFLHSRRIDALLVAIPKAPAKYPFHHLVQLIYSSPWDVMERWVSKLGPIVRFGFMGHTYLIVADPALIRHVFHTNMKNYLKDRTSYAPFMCILGTGLVTSEGKLWRKQRALVSAAFRIEILQDATDMATRATRRLIDDRLTPFLGTTKCAEMAEEFRHLTLQVIGEAVLSLQPQESDDVFPRLYLPIVEEANRRSWYPFLEYLPTPGAFAYNRCVRGLNDYVSNLIRDRTNSDAEPEHPDILDRIIAGVRQSPSVPNTGPLPNASVEQIRDEIKTFLFAGHETSSAMMTWTLFQLSQNPEAMRRVRQEADAMWGPDGRREPSYEEVRDGLTFTRACLRESLRLYSVVPVVTREAAEDDVIQDTYNIPKGTKMVICMQAVHHREDIWPDAMTWKPERMLADPSDPYAFLPFIGGPRACLGQFFALLETKIVLTRLLRELDFTPAPGCDGTRHQYMIPVIPNDNLRMLVTRRKR